MKAFFHFTVPLLALITMVACAELEVSEEANDSINNGILQELSITGKDYIFDGETRSSVTIGEDGASFAWDEDDVIGIFPDKGDQVSFAMDEGAGTQTATFSGGGWALKSSSRYAAYYPHVYENRDLTAIPVNYLGQTQNGNANTDHIGAYDFMAASVTTPENGSVAFDMQHLGALVQLTITVPEPSTLTKVILTSSTEFTEKGTIDLTANTPSIVAKTQSKKLEITLKDVTTTKDNETITVYFMTAPVDLTEAGSTATIYFEDGMSRNTNIAGKNLAAGNAYRLSADFNEDSTETEGTIPNHQIWYTSSDNSILTLYNTDGYGAKIVSHTYNNGKGVISFDGDISTICDGAFYGMNRLTSITIPQSVTTIETDAFYSCYSLKEVILMPNGLTTICDDAFCLCSSLANITIPDTVTSIGNFAFSRCTGLASIILPDSIVSIGSRAFSGCSSLSEITIPKNVTTIGDCAFGQCPYLKITVDADNPALDSRDNCNAIIETSSNTLIHGCNYTIIPNTVTAIGGHAFAYCEFESITIPEGVTSIGGAAFFECYSLKSIDIPNSVNSIQSSAFYNCSSLKSIVIPDGVTRIEDSTFSNCQSLSKLSIPNSVKTIGEWAFSSCGSLTNITIPGSVVEIENGAFKTRAYYSSTITILAVIPPKIYNSETFDHKADIYVPAGSFEAYKAADYWKNLNLIEQVSSIQAIDLGLSVKWANCNVGANSPEEYGDYFAWGETEPKPSYDYSSMLILEKIQEGLKLNRVVDANNNLTASYDAAAANWGENWRMPTRTEIEELLNNCTWTWSTQNGTKGYLVCSKTNENSIFLPAAGFRQEAYPVSALNESGFYLSATHDNDIFMFCLQFNNNGIDDPYRGCNSCFDCSMGFSVRPVTK